MIRELPYVTQSRPLSRAEHDAVEFTAPAQRLGPRSSIDGWPFVRLYGKVREIDRRPLEVVD